MSPTSRQNDKLAAMVLENEEAALNRIDINFQNSKAAWWAAAAAALISGWHYWPTVHPGVGPVRFLDSIQYQTAVSTFGIPHPPGYPLYIILGKLFTLLPGIGRLAPFGDNVAYRLGLFSAVVAALTIFVLVLFIFRLTNHAGAAFLSGLILAGGRSFWIQATYVELYPLYTFMVAGWFLLMTLWQQTGQNRYYFGGTAVFALSFGVNVPAIILLPAWFWIVLITNHRMLTQLRNSVGTAVIVLLSALQFAYIPLRAFIFGPPNFCNFCPGNWSELPAFLTGEIWRNQRIVFGLEPQHWLQRWGETGGELMLQFWPIWIMVGGIGLWHFWHKNWRIAGFITVGLAGIWFFVTTYRVVDWADFMLPVFVLYTVLIGIGMAEIWAAVGQLGRGEGKIVVFLTRRALPLTLVLLTLVLITATFRHSQEIAVKFVEGNGSMNNHWAARSMLNQMQEDAWLLAPPTTTDGFNQTWAIRYVAWAEGDAPNFTLIYPPRISDLLQPPGPQPGYIAWEDAEAGLANQPLYALELNDSRLQEYVLFPFYNESGWPVGYQIVGKRTAEGITLWIPTEQFTEIEGVLIFP
jgi:hypothetical protein